MFFKLQYTSILVRVSLTYERETIVNFINWTRMLGVGVGGYVQNPNITFVLNIISN